MGRDGKHIRSELMVVCFPTGKGKAAPKKIKGNEGFPRLNATHGVWSDVSSEEYYKYMISVFSFILQSLWWDKLKYFESAHLPISIPA